MIQINYSDPAARVNSDQIQATRITGILSGHRAENANILGGTDQNIAHYWGGGTSFTLRKYKGGPDKIMAYYWEGEDQF